MSFIKSNRGFISISIIGLILFLTTIVLILINLNKSNFNKVNDPVEEIEEGVHFGNINDASNPAEVPMFIMYYIDIENNYYNYGEEFTIRYRTGKNPLFSEYIDDGDLKISIVADDFEILSQQEYIYKDFHTPKYEVYSNDNHEEIFPIDIEIKIKAMKKKCNVNSILFLLDYTLSEELKEKLTSSDDNYIFGTHLFTNDLKQIHQQYYMNDELGTILIAEKYYKHYNNETQENINLDTHYELMYRSFNRLYNEGLITKEEYLDRLVYGIFKNEIILRFETPDNNNFFIEYLSENIRICYKTNKEDYLYSLLINPTTEKNIQVVKELLNILFAKEKISLDEYNREIDYINNGEIKRPRGGNGIFSFLIPFENYENYLYDFIIEK